MKYENEVLIEVYQITRQTETDFARQLEILATLLFLLTYAIEGSNAYQSSSCGGHSRYKIKD